MIGKNMILFLKNLQDINFFKNNIKTITNQIDSGPLTTWVINSIGLTIFFNLII